MIPEPVEVTLRVTAVLESLGAPYAISGSLASALDGAYLQQFAQQVGVQDLLEQAALEAHLKR